MKKKIFDLLLLKKKINKNQSFKEISSLTKEKNKNKNAVDSLNDVLKNSGKRIGELMTSRDLKNFSNFQSEIQKRIKISKGREKFLKTEIKNKMTELLQLKSQEDIVKNKIKDIENLAEEEKDKKDQITSYNKGILF